MYGSNNGDYVKVNGRNVYFEAYGKGDTVLMLHGGPGSIADFSKLIPELAKKYRVIAIDSPGHGYSDRTDKLSYPVLAKNASGFIDEIGITKCYVIGWSDGATTGLLLAAMRPDVVTKVFASSGFSNFNAFKEDVKKYWLAFTPEVVEESWEGWHLEYQNTYPKCDWRTLISDLGSMILHEVYISEEQLESISCDVLLAYGDRDLFTLEHEIYLYRTIPKANLMILPGTSHMTIQEQPEMIQLAINNFFKKEG